MVGPIAVGLARSCRLSCNEEKQKSGATSANCRRTSVTKALSASEYWVQVVRRLPYVWRQNEIPKHMPRTSGSPIRAVA
jgi:hypothetical protein